jgi:hypothetical protein
MIYLSIRDEFAKRGVSCLMVDQPGVGEALRLGGVHAIAESERWAATALDYLEPSSSLLKNLARAKGW